MVFMLKLQDQKALPRSAADTLFQQIMAIAPYCPTVPRGKSKTALQGWMKCMMERYSRNAGEYGRTRAEQQDSSVADLADAILQGQTDAVSLAFPHLMNQAYRRCYQAPLMLRTELEAPLGHASATRLLAFNVLSML